MGQKTRVLVLIALGVIIAAIMIYPNLGQISSKEFAVTENPADALDKVKGKGTPVVLEFYAVW